ncbi:N-6 DNA methylase, partial [Spirulina major CS-329]|uniref:class I SAM-dependent DNA methyltransferase n=2 Tax=Spirulinaceae TaxID=1890448 RepID=UPI00232D26B3
EELRVLEVAALEDWGKVRPAIFGNIFESAIDVGERHAHGIHYTSEADIMKIVRPTISRYWEERIEGANTIQELTILQEELRNYRVLDPACGSGNFLYLAYQELKQIEQDLLDKIAERRRSNAGQKQIGFVTPLQFFGIDSNRFAVELARVTLTIARKVAIDRLDLIEPVLPLDTLDDNIVCKDALFTKWPEADAIIGNPPFLGGYRMRKELGDKYTEKVSQAFPEVKDKVDFCIYWFRLAHDRIQQSGRVGLVGTNTVSQGTSRIASLDYITQNNGYIHEAVSTQPWSGQANVHVSIVNWMRYLPKELHLDNQIVSQISSSLKCTTDVSQSKRLRNNHGYCFEGVKPTGKGFIISLDRVNEWTLKDANNRLALKPFLDARSLTNNPSGSPYRWIIDFYGMTLEEASDFMLPFEHVRTFVKPKRDTNRDQRAKENWWLSPRPRPEMRLALSKLKNYFIVPRHSKWFIFLIANSSWLPSDSTKVVSSDDFYVLGILTSKTHRVWVKAQSSTLEDRTRYTHNTCFETFPFPQTPAPKIVEKIRATATALHEYRSQEMERKQWGITKLYNAYFDEPASQLYKLHQQLDKLVLRAYGFKPNDDLLEKLLTLNLQLAAQEEAGETVIGPWAP